MKVYFVIFFLLFSLLGYSQAVDDSLTNPNGEGGNGTKPKTVVKKRQLDRTRTTQESETSEVQFNALITVADSLFAQKKNSQAKNKYEEALIIKPNSNVVISKITKIESILNNERLDKIKQDKLLKDNPKAKNGLGNKQINLYKYLFFAAVLLAGLLFFLILRIYKQMDKYKSKYSEAKISLYDNIRNFQNTIVYFNSLLKSLGKEEEIVLKYNEVKTTDDMPIQSIEEIFVDFNYELNSIANQAEHIESEHLKNKTVLDKIESEASMPVSQLAEKYKETVIELIKVKDELKIKSNSSNEAVSLDVPRFEIPDGVFINSNILVSSGPRKDKDNDTELGEDATGILNTQYGTFFWILDGTSDSPSIVNDKEHIFSSRILAQLLNKNIREELIQKSNENINLKELLLNSVESSKRDLMEKLKSSSNDILQKIASNIKSNNIPFCSTTVLIGFLSKQGTLQYFYLGDSEVLSFYNDVNKLIAKEKDKNDNPSRLFVSILMNENSFILKTNSFDEKLVVYKKENIDLVVAFSDGIGTSEKSLLVNPVLSLSKISLVNQLTYDDKTLLVLERTKK